MKQVGKCNIHQVASRVFSGLVFGALCLVSGVANAQAYPSRPIKIVVPWGAGGVTDNAARVMAQKLSERLSVPVIVESKAGAAGTIGATFVARAPADGYTLLMASSETNTIAPNIRPKLPYAPQKDFTPLIPFAIVPFALVARPGFPANTLNELIALVKKSPGKFTYASPGVGSTSQLGMEALKILGGLDILGVHFQSQATTMFSLVSGQTDLEMLAAGQAAVALKAGQLKVIAVMTPDRVAEMPGVPTFREAGLPGMNFSNWFGFVAPAGLPAPIAQRLATEMSAIVKMADVKAAFQTLGLKEVDPPMSSPEFEKFLESETARWGAVIRSANIKVD
ncbi:MAG: tripartite tricarboxylate transporter substrate binding protein [Pseudomonadota bacterium]